MTDTTEPRKTPASLLVDLLSYIEQVEKLRKRATFVVPKDPFAALEAEVRGLPDVEFNLVAGGDDVWMKVTRLKEISVPPLPDQLEPWVTLSKSPDKLAELKSEILLPPEEGGPPKTVQLSAVPGIKRSFDEYMDSKWTPWSNLEKPRRKTIALYNKLFGLQQAIALEGAEAALELVWGIGVAVWKRSGADRTVEHPLICCPVEVSLDERTFALEIRPRDQDPILEVDAYSELEIPSVAQLEGFWRAHLDAASSTVSPFERPTFESTLRRAVALLDNAGQYHPDTNRSPEDRTLPKPGEHLVVTDTWVVFARKRSEHPYLQDVARLKKKLERAKSVPGALEALVTPGSADVVDRPTVTFRGLSHSFGEPGAGVKELYFPMPYNDEQVLIVEQLETSDGVVVQGPPGTGKTHTIANVICHFLAQGKRVLVTSKGESALSVLQEKIPEEVRALTVSLLSDEREGMKQFELAIQTIASQVNELNPRTLSTDIATGELQLSLLHQRIAALDHNIAGYAAKHLKSLPFQGRQMTPAELAKFVIDREGDFSWLQDPVRSGQSYPLQFADADIQALRAARLALGRELCYLTAALPVADSFIDGRTLALLHHDLMRAHAIDIEVGTGKLVPLVDSTPATFERAKALGVFLDEMAARLAAVREAKLDWSDGLREFFRTSTPDEPVLEHLDALAASVEELERSRRRLLNRPVSVPSDSELDEDYLGALARLAEGKSAFVLPIGKKDARRRIAATTISGVKPESEDDWSHVTQYCAMLAQARMAVANWNALASEHGLPAADGTPERAFRRIFALQAHVAQVKLLAMQYDRPLPGKIAQVFGTAFRPAELYTDKGLESVRVALGAHLDKGRLSYANAAIDDMKRKLQGKSGPIVDAMGEFLSRRVGNAAQPDGAIADGWNVLLADLRRLAGLRPHFERVAAVADLVEKSGAPAWARRMRKEPATADFDPCCPTDWLEAWNWRCAKSFLEAIDGHEQLKQMHAQRHEAEAELARTYRQLVAAKTWIEVYNHSPNEIRQALQAYLNAIQQIGRGTGIRAVRYRRDARDAMARAYAAVPCWIMPHWRVSESIPPEIGLFDLVVIDEASQSDIWALPALLRGRKLLVVGDHMQVSPDSVGVQEAKILELRQRFLNAQVHGAQMTPEKSVYDLARVVFAGSSNMLKEHFRCVMPIIEFSNREFYEGRIKPLRIPPRSQRLDPPLIDVFVKGGYREGDTNKPEAYAVLDEIRSIIDDPLLKGRTIGVVTLMGNEQAPFIHRLIQSHIPLPEIVERQIAVGAPPVFQGRERDIMLLSMVVSRGKMGAASGQIYDQRFNVAASRARDRMVLFRSVDIADLNPRDLKARLIGHFHQPLRQDEHTVEDLRNRCESPFETEVFDHLIEKGYRVLPQVPVSSYRIDLVVEGSEDRRLAIECDGDRFHGPAQWQADMTRQRVLERAGWTFWRCFASTFVLRKEAVMSDLLSTLRRMGIEPIGHEPADACAFVAHRVIELSGDLADSRYAITQ